MNAQTKDALSCLTRICPTERFYPHVDGHTLCADLLFEVNGRRIDYLLKSNIVRLHPDSTDFTLMLRVDEDLLELQVLAVSEETRRLALYDSCAPINTVLAAKAGISVIYDHQFLSAAFKPSLETNSALEKTMAALQLAKAITVYDLNLVEGRLTILAADPCQTQAYLQQEGIKPVLGSMIGERRRAADPHQQNTV